MAAATEALAGPGMWVQPLEVDGAPIGLVVASPMDLVGTMDRWALRALDVRRAGPGPGRGPGALRGGPSA